MNELKVGAWYYVNGVHVNPVRVERVSKNSVQVISEFNLKCKSYGKPWFYDDLTFNNTFDEVKK